MDLCKQDPHKAQLVKEGKAVWVVPTAPADICRQDPRKAQLAKEGKIVIHPINDVPEAIVVGGNQEELARIAKEQQKRIRGERSVDGPDFLRPRLPHPPPLTKTFCPLRTFPCLRKCSASIPPTGTAAASS